LAEQRTADQHAEEEHDRPGPDHDRLLGGHAREQQHRSGGRCRPRPTIARKRLVPLRSTAAVRNAAIGLMRAAAEGGDRRRHDGHDHPDPDDLDHRGRLDPQRHATRGR
jgi:hypothetical protein